MEDAVKALLIVSGVFIGLMIISLGVALFYSLSQYTDTTQNKIEENALQQFNEQFIKYVNCGSDPDAIPEFTLTIHDIVTVANIAYESNKNYGLDSASDYNYYVTINMPGITNLEKVINEKAAEILSNNIENKYICIANDVKTNPNTGRVCEMTFKKYDET